ncbi:MAG: hypothetical protein ACYS5V_17665 [Planctomycetota bacterium]|jgi:hypothetical protein
MLQAINDAIVNAADYLFGWVLYLPRDLRLIVVAVLTSAVLVLVRKLATDQDWLGRAADDRKRLRELIRQARAARDKDARKRHKQTIMLIKLKALRFEPRPLLVAIVPVAVVAVWAFGRLAYEPPRRGETVELRLYVPNSDIGTVDRPYLLGQEGIEVERTDTGGALQEVVRDAYPEPEGWWDRLNDPFMPKPALTGVARWRIKAVGEAERYTLKIYHKGKTYEKDFRVDGRHHPSAYDVHDDATIIGVILQPWLVAYLLIAIPFVSVLKALCRIH